MYKGCASNSPVWAKVMQWLGVVSLLTIVAMVGWSIMPCDHQSTEALKWFQFVQTVGTFLLPPFIVAWLWSAEPLEWLGLRRKVKGERKKELFLLYGGVIVLMVVAIPGINLLADWNSRLALPAFMAGIEQWMRAQEDAAMMLTERFLNVRGFGPLLVNIGLMALLPAMAEELTFRGVIQSLVVGRSSLDSRRKHIAVWVTAILFSAIHLQFYGFVPRMLLGALFGYALIWTGSLWVPIIAHALNNSTVVLFSYLTHLGLLNEGYGDHLGLPAQGSFPWLAIFSIIASSALVILANNFYRKKGE